MIDPKPDDHLLKLSTSDVLVGMYVCELDCRWADTPFPLGGFHVKNADDILILQKFCKVVTIDINKGAEPARRRRTNLTILSSARRAAPQATTLKVDRDAYPVTESVKQLIDKSYKDYEQLNAVMENLFSEVREGHALPLRDLKAPADAVIYSILKNPQAFIWILNTENGARKPAGYCVRAAIWASILARQFGLPREDIDCLFHGTILADVGMNLLPERLVHKQGGFRKKEYMAYRKHVDLSLHLLSPFPELEEKLIKIVRTQHERHDGLGFPKGLKGDQIPALARFSSLAYCFEQLLRSNKPEQRVSPAKAISRMYKQRELKFPEQLVVEFIHVLGTYPIGSVVQLSSGELAIVWEQNREERLSPVVGLITDNRQAKLAKPKLLDLSAQKDSQRISITRSVNPGGLDINTADYTFAFVGKQLKLGGFAIRF